MPKTKLIIHKTTKQITEIILGKDKENITELITN